MPLPSSPLSINGGCHCKAIRYRVSIPEESKRPIHPTLKDTKSESCRQPYIGICHCNSCRTAIGTILPAWLCLPAEMVEVACPSEADKYRPGLEMLAPADEIDQVNTIKLYHSSPKISRSFCRNCGTNISCYEKPAEGGRHVIDICLGTIDRSDLDKEFMIPERQLWWDDGIGWVKNMTVGKADVEHAPRHPAGKVGEEVEKGDMKDK